MADLDPRWGPKVQSITLSREYYDELIARERELLDQVATLTFELAELRMKYRKMYSPLYYAEKRAA